MIIVLDVNTTAVQIIQIWKCKQNKWQKIMSAYSSISQDREMIKTSVTSTGELKKCHLPK